MQQLDYDWDELFSRLRAEGCVHTKLEPKTDRRGRLVQIFYLECNGESHVVDVPPFGENPTYSVVRSVCRQLKLPEGPFDLDPSKKRPSYKKSGARRLVIKAP